MSTKPELDYKLENNKVLVSLTLKVPIQFEIELGMENQEVCSGNEVENTEHRDIQKAVQQTVDANINEIINEINQTFIDEQVEVLSNKLSRCILRNRPGQFISDNNEIPLPFSNIEQIHNPEAKLASLFGNNSSRQYRQGLLIEKQLQKHNYDNFDDNFDGTVEIVNEQQFNQTKRKGRFADSVNDGFTLVINCVGAMLFLGKLANYSWE